MKKLALLLGALTFLLAPSASQAREAKSGFDTDARVALDGYEALVEQQLEWALASLKTLAATEEAVSGDWEHLKGPLGKLAEGMPTHAAIWFARPDGSYFTVEKGLTDQNLKDRAYFPLLLGGRDVAGDLVISKSTGKKSVVVATPVKADGKVVGALGISVSVEQLAQLVEDRMRFPKDVAFYALDTQGQTALHRETKLMFEFPSDMGSPTLSAAVKTMLTEPEGMVSYEFGGKQKLAIFQKSKLTGWVFVLGKTK